MDFKLCPDPIPYPAAEPPAGECISPPWATPGATRDMIAALSIIVPECGHCPEQATCVYSYGAGDFAACGAHDPTRQPGWLTAAAPMFFTYRTLASPFAAVPYTTGHLGVVQPL